MTADQDRPRPPRAPAGLDTAGRALWRALTKVYGFEPWELQLLAQACRQADVVAELDGALQDAGTLFTTGSTGQTVVNPGVAEARQGRLAIARLLGELKLPADSTEAATVTAMTVAQNSRSRRASKAAAYRWRQDRRRRDGSPA